MRRYAIVVLALALTAVATAAGWSWQMGELTGDLTRVGGWPERDFAPRQPAETVTLAPSSTGSVPDIVVVGDSFSLSGVWQPATFGGERYATYDIEHFCFARYLESAQFRNAPPRVVVVQTVERLYLHRFGGDAWCPRHSEQAVVAHPEHWKGYRASAPSGFAGIAPGFALDALRASFREWRSPAVTRSGDSTLTGLTQASLFSNHRADRILLCAGDEAKATWSAQEVEQSVRNVRALGRRIEANGRTTFVFVLVPDKSTAYAPWLRVPTLATDLHLGDRLAAAGVNAPRVDRAIADAVATGMRDVYLPNDTHLSAGGFGLLATTLRHAIPQLAPQPAARATDSTQFPSRRGS